MLKELLTQERRQAKSLLSGVQRGWLTFALILTALLLANTLYLIANRLASAALPGVTAERYAEGAYTISKLFQVMVLSHTGLGFLIVGLLLVFAIWHLPKVWRRHRRRTVVSGFVFLTTGLIRAITGPFIMYAAASRDHSWVWWTHVVAAAIVPAAYIVHRTLSYVPAQSGAFVRIGTLIGGATAVVFGMHVLGARDTALTPEAQRAQAVGSYTGPGSKERNLVEFVDGPYVPVGYVPPASPFFPSAATTTTGGYLPERIITRSDVSSPEKPAPDLDNIGFVVNENIGAETNTAQSA